MARVLVVQHTGSEGLGAFADWLPAAGLDPHPIHPYLGHRVPAVVEGDALMVLGGPMSAYDDDAAPWLPAVRALLTTAVEDGVPTIGICLGAQLLALACGGEVTVPGTAGAEIGVGLVDVAPPGDVLLAPGPLRVVHWHRDAITRLPHGAAALAASPTYQNQAFRLGNLAWGLQFHVETTTEQIAGWASESAADLASIGIHSDDIVAEVADAEDELVRDGKAIAERFAAIVTG